MSKRGKILKDTKELLVEQGRILVGFDKIKIRLDKLSSEDQWWYLKKLIKSPEFSDLPGELPMKIAQEFSNVETRLKNEKAPLKIITNNFVDEDDLPF